MANTEIQLGDIPIFAALSKKELKDIQKLMSQITVAEGKVLTKQGEVGREFMIIRNGTCRVEVDGNTVAHLSPGDFAGELAVISGAPRTATVVATSEVSLEVLNRREFMALLDESPSVARKILVASVKRLQENDARATN